MIARRISMETRILIREYRALLKLMQLRMENWYGTASAILLEEKESEERFQAQFDPRTRKVSLI